MALAFILGSVAGAVVPAPGEAAEKTAWVVRRQEWVAARAARSDARWSGTSVAIEAAALRADRAESLYISTLDSWIRSAAGGAGGLRLEGVSTAQWGEVALELIEHDKIDTALAVLNGPLRGDRGFLAVRAHVTGMKAGPDSGLSLLDWPPDRRPRHARPTRWDRVARTAPEQADAAYLVAASLAESTKVGRATRAALWRLVRHRDTRQAYARLKLARGLVQRGEHRLAAEILSSAVLHDDEERFLLAELRADLRLELADTTGAIAVMTGVTRDGTYGAAQRVAAAREAAPWLRGARVDSLSEAAWLEFVRSLGELGETDPAIGYWKRRKAAAPDSAAQLARAEVEAALYARAKRHADAAAAYRKLLVRPGLPEASRAKYALGLARAKRGVGDFAACDSAFLVAVAFDSSGSTGATAAWERAREWEDRKDPREAARVLDWSRRYQKDPGVLRTRTIHGALAWWRAGEPDSAVATFGNSSTEYAVFWKSRILMARGDTTGAIRELRGLPPGDSWTYEGVRAAEELTRHSGASTVRDGVAPVGKKAGSPPAVAQAAAPLTARIYGAIGATQWMMDAFRECAGTTGPRARACTEALEERGIFRVGRSANVPADRLDYPPAYPEAVLGAARTEGLSPSLIWAIMRQESAYLRGVRSKAGAIGLLQLIPPTASRLAGSPVSEEQLYESDRNVRLGARYLRALLAEFGDARAAAAAYNAGEDAVRRWIRDFGPVDDFWVERIPYRETRDYVRQVYTIVKRYERMYGTPPPDGKGG